MEQQPDEFALTLLSYRKAMGFTQEDLATKALVDHQNPPTQRDISNYELGNSKPRLDKLAALVDVLHLNQRETMHLIRLAERLTDKARSRRAAE